MSTGARIIWILFGNMEGFEKDIPKLKNVYKRYDSTLKNKGYSLGIPNYFLTKQGMCYLISDQATVGMVWHSHGVYNQDGHPMGYLVDRDKNVIKPSNILSPSKNLQFAALFGCGILKLKAAWINAFGLNKFSDSSSRLAGSGDKIAFWDRNAGLKKTRAYPRKYAEDSFFSNRFFPYDFGYLIDKLPQIE